MKTSKRASTHVAALSALLLMSMSAGGALAGPPTTAPGKPTTSASATPAASAPARTPTPAEEAFAKGSQLYAAQKWDEALSAFREAWSQQKTYDIAANLGHTEYKLGKLKEAAGHLSFAVRGWPVVGKQEARELAKQRFDEVRQKVAAVTIEVNVAGAEVTIDGASVGRSPVGEDVFVDPGAHRVEVKLSGYEVGRASVEAKAGGTHAVKIELAREGSETPGGLGRGTRLGLIIGGAALSAAAIGVGVGFMAAANRKDEETATLATEIQQITPKGSAACEPPTLSNASKCTELQSKLDDLDRFDSIALASLIAGGVLTAGTVAVVVLTRSRSSKTVQSSAILVPTFGAAGGGAMIVGRW